MNEFGKERVEGIKLGFHRIERRIRSISLAPVEKERVALHLHEVALIRRSEPVTRHGEHFVDGLNVEIADWFTLLDVGVSVANALPEHANVMSIKIEQRRIEIEADDEFVDGRIGEFF